MLFKLWMFLNTPRDSEEGATAVEYGLMVALIAVVIIVAVTTIGEELDRLFTYVADTLTAVIP